MYLESQLQLPSPLQEIKEWSDSNTQYFIKRDDLIDSYISGNKYRKLKGHLIYYFKNQRKYSDGIVTYGGAYSNHLYSAASACKNLDIQMTAIVRGLEVDMNNQTLSHVVQCGTEIIKISRTEYRKKDKGEVVSRLIKNGNYLIVPEGGNNNHARLGVKELVNEIYNTLTPDFICLMSGTGATAEGILNEIKGSQTNLIVCSAVRDDSVKQRILQQDEYNQVVWRDELWGGFGKSRLDLINTMDQVIKETSIPLEYVYSGRLMAHLTLLRKENYFPNHSKVVIIHTGGLRVSSH